MELQALRYFLAVVQEKNITRASRILRISQPALSRQLQRLEEESGGSLLERTNTGIVLTEKGLYLAERAREMVALADKIVANLKTNDEALHGEIYIGGGETERMRAVIGSFNRLQAQHPHVKIRIFSGNGNDVLDKLNKGVLDFGLVIEPFDVKAYHHVVLPSKDRWGILTRRDHPLGQKQSVSVEDLQQEPLLLSEQSRINHYFSDSIGLDVDSCQIVGTYNLLFNASLLVKEGLGHALCIDHIINTTGTDLCFVPIAPRLESRVYLIWKKEAMLSRPATKLLELIQSTEAQPDN